MGEMDIYMRRRLVALGGLVGFFILFVLLVKSCGGDEETPLTTTPAGTTGPTEATALSRAEYIAQADSICAEANAAVGALDPNDAQATADEYDITRDELAQLKQLTLAKKDATQKDFLAALSDVVRALDDKATAENQGDDLGAGEAQVAIDEAEVEARGLGEDFGFRDCGQFLDAGQAPSSGGAAAGTDTSTGTDTGAVVAPTTTTPVTPAPAPTTTTPVAPPADDSGGITP
jgi:hypothetical protein